MLAFWILLTLLFKFNLSVDRGKFKTCEQSDFCKRQRNFNSTLKYIITKDSISIKGGSLSFNLEKLNQAAILCAKLHIKDNNILHFEIDELPSIRFRSKDALLQHLPPIMQNTHFQTHDDWIEIPHNNYKIHINMNPFNLIIYLNQKKILSINSANLFNFEQTPDEKDEEDDPVLNDSDTENNVAKKKEIKSYEVSFDSHTDSRPHGDTSIGLDIKFNDLKHLYGIPEHADNLLLKSTSDGDPYRLYNFDVFEYEVYNRMALYGSIPYLIAHSQSHTVGVYWNNPSEMWIDVDVDDVKHSSVHWMTESGILDLYILLGPSPVDVFKQYALLTGVTPLPPISTLGYHQSRWNYNSQTDVETVLDHFDQYDIPLDFIWLDIEHTDGKRYFTWDKINFPHPVEMINYLASKSRKLVTIVDPHIKVDDNYNVYKEANDKSYFVKTRDKNDYEGWCWPGQSKYPDFANQAVRDWWSSNFKFDKYDGTTNDVYVWNDMNEPSVFNGPEVTMPKDCIHVNDTEHRDVHNIYGLYVHSATYEGMIQRNSSTRPYVLSRAFFAGSQRTTSVWTGDNSAEWSHLKISEPMILSLSITGMTFSGADVGGFFKNPDEQLLLRWYQAAAYQPFFRAHAHIDTIRREPWKFPNAMPYIREAIYERYTFIPYWYTLFYESETSGQPVMRPLWVEYPSENETFAIDNEHMIGNALLIHPITDPDIKEVNVYFPGRDEIWYDMFSTNVITHTPALLSLPAKHIFVYQRGGTIVPRKMRLRRSATISNQFDPYTLFIALDNKKSAYGTLYIDDGITFNYRNGKYIYAEFTFKDDTLTCQLKHNNYQSLAWYERFVIRGIRRPKGIVNTSQKKDLITFTYDERAMELVVKKPVQNVDTQWQFFFKF